ncbi:hypothetical protein QTN25_008043 [Entamoeba marina]
MENVFESDNFSFEPDFSFETNTLTDTLSNFAFNSQQPTTPQQNTQTSSNSFNNHQQLPSKPTQNDFTTFQSDFSIPSNQFPTEFESFENGFDTSDTTTNQPSQTPKKLFPPPPQHQTKSLNSSQHTPTISSQHTPTNSSQHTPTISSEDTNNSIKTSPQPSTQKQTQQPKQSNYSRYDLIREIASETLYVTEPPKEQQQKQNVVEQQPEFNDFGFEDKMDFNSTQQDFSFDQQLATTLPTETNTVQQTQGFSFDQQLTTIPQTETNTVQQTQEILPNSSSQQKQMILIQTINETNTNDDLNMKDNHISTTPNKSVDFDSTFFSESQTEFDTTMNFDSTFTFNQPEPVNNQPNNDVQVDTPKTPPTEQKPISLMSWEDDDNTKEWNETTERNEELVNKITEARTRNKELKEVGDEKLNELKKENEILEKELNELLTENELLQKEIDVNKELENTLRNENNQLLLRISEMKQSVKVKKGSAIDQSVTTKAIKRENDELHEQISLGFDDFITSNDSPNIPLQKQEEQQEEQQQVVVNDEINQQNELTKETIQPKRNDSPQPQPKENLNELLKIY